MNSATHAADEDPGSETSNTGAISHAGALISGSQQFSITGGTFTNIIKNYSTLPAVPSDFPRIPMGDIDLQHEIQLNHESGVVSLRTLHSAKINRGRSSVTVAMYQGDRAEQEWRQDIEKYMTIRHPNFVQLYGTSTCGNIHAAIFHDDLIPFQQFVDLYRHSHFSTVYIRAYIDIEFKRAQNYFWDILERHLRDYNCTFFIRRSTGRFCADLVPGGVMLLKYPEIDERSMQQGLEFLSRENSEATIINALTLEQYHSICYWQFSVIRFISIPPHTTVNNICGVFNGASGDLFSDMVEIAYLPNVELAYMSRDWEMAGGRFGEFMEDGWTRVASGAILGTTVGVRTRWLLSRKTWLTQANYVFTSLQISASLQDYVVLDYIYYSLTIPPVEGPIPTGFLFLCPSKLFQRGKSSFKWPDCPAYWSLEPSGVGRLTAEHAVNLGFPSLLLSTEIVGYSWNASVYAGLRQFHQGKGFDPDSQDLARYLGQDLYQLSTLTQTCSPSAHIDGENPLEARHTGRDLENEEFCNSKLEPTFLTDNLAAAYHADEVPVAITFKFAMTVQMLLILFPVLLWVLFQIY